MSKAHSTMHLLIRMLEIADSFEWIYNSSKAVFTLGLLFFSIMMVSHNIIAVYAYFAMAPLYSTELHPYILGIHFTELMGLAVLLKITWS